MCLHIYWIKKQQPIPVFLPGKSQGQKSLVGYSQWDHKRVEQNLVTKQQKHIYIHIYIYVYIYVYVYIFEYTYIYLYVYACMKIQQNMNDIWNNIDEYQSDYTEWKKPCQIRGDRLCDSMY